MFLLFLLPKNLLSFAVGRLVRMRFPFGFHRWMRDKFVAYFKIDMTEAEFPQDKYETIGALFTRHLKPSARPIGEAKVVSPVDGTWVRSGVFGQKECLFKQIKGKTYSLSKITGTEWKEADFAGGCFQTIYLAPHNYHRIHSPIKGRITKAVFLPGNLWPVNHWSVETIDELFGINERLILEITDGDGVMLVVMVGATNVGAITSPQIPGFSTNQLGQKKRQVWNSLEVAINKGEEIGCFNMGSTVVLIGNASMTSMLPELSDLPRPLQMGESLF